MPYIPKHYVLLQHLPLPDCIEPMPNHRPSGIGQEPWLELLLGHRAADNGLNLTGPNQAVLWQLPPGHLPDLTAVPHPADQWT